MTARPRRSRPVSGRPATWLEAGAGDPLVLVHGAGGSAEHWAPQLEGLAPASRILAVDLPGHGPPGGAGETSVDAYAGWLDAFATALGLERVVLGGHSLGGAIALGAALAAPGWLRGLVLVGTGARLRVLPRLLELLEARPPEGQDLVLGLCRAAGTPPERLEAVGRALRATPPLVTLGDFLACDRFDVRDRLAAIRVPTLVVAGAEDRLTPPRYGQFLAETIPGARLVEVAGAGHFPQLEQPDRVNAAIREFLAGLPGAPRP